MVVVFFLRFTCFFLQDFYKNVEKLICHKCDFKQNIGQVKKCCDNPVLTPLGIGTQRVEDKIKELFPNKNVLRVDSDNITSKKELEKVKLIYDKKEVRQKFFHSLKLLKK